MEGAATPDPGGVDHIRRDERRSGVLVILPEHKKIITALPGELRQQQNQGGRIEGGRS